MKSFKYRGFDISAHNSQYNLKSWCITINGNDPFGNWKAWYNVEQEGPRRWWHSRRHDNRTFEEALNNVLEEVDRRSRVQARSKEHELLMEARLSLAEELLP